VLLRALVLCAGQSGALEKVRIRRKTGYSFYDALVFIMAMACWDTKGTIKEFSRVSHKDNLDRVLASIAGRRDWPTDSSMSRLLKSVRREDTEEFCRHILPLTQPGELTKSPWVMTRDAHGQLWAVFDLDGIVNAFRRRALPRGDDLPEPERWTDEVAAPGYPGRKRGETQVSSHRLQQAGSSAWVGQGSEPGNTVMSEAVAQAVSWLSNFCEQAGLDKEHVLLRIDGAGGNTRCVGALAAAGTHFVVRWAYCESLDRSAVRAHLRGEVWSPVVSSRSGPQRHAAELGEGRWLEGTNQLPAATRLVVSRFPSAEEGKKRGSGHIIGPAQYELYATDLDAGGFPAEDVVSLYYGRAAHENSFNQGNREKRLQRTFCKTNRHGQNLAQLILMLMWNLETALGAKILDLPEQRPPQASRPPRQVRSFDDIPELQEVDVEEEATQVSVEQRVAKRDIDAGDTTGTVDKGSTSSGYGVTESSPAATVVTDETVDVLRAALAQRPGWSVSKERGVTCPQGTTLRLRRQPAATDRGTRLLFRAPRGICGRCPGRRDCTSSTLATFRKDLDVTVPSVLPPLKGWPPARPPGRRPGQRKRPAAAIVPGLEAEPDWCPPPRREPGPRAMDGPAVVSADLRVAFFRACEDIRVRVQLVALAPRPRQPHHLVPTAAQRQRRRHTHEERHAWNALPPHESPTVVMTEASAIERLLDRAFAAPAAA
jgi:hypothetical protein